VLGEAYTGESYSGVLGVLRHILRLEVVVVWLSFGC